MKIILVMLILISSLFAYKIENSDGDTIFFIGGKDNNRISINCGDEIDEDYALKVCGKILADGFDSNSVIVGFDDDVSQKEGDDKNTMSFKLVLNKKHTKDVTVKLKSVEDTATEGDDYEKHDKDKEYTIKAGDLEATETVDITILGDTDAEKDEKFKLEITEVTEADKGNASAIGTIENDDEAPIIQALDGDKKEKEGDELKFDIEADTKVDGDVKIKWEIEHVGTNDDDFDALSGTVIMKDGDKKTFIKITPTQDELFGDDEKYKVKLVEIVSGDAVLGDDVTQECKILNEDDEPTIEYKDIKKDESEGDHKFSIELSEEVETKVSVTIYTEDGDAKDGNAKDGDDYDAKEESLEWTEGSAKAKEFVVNIIDDDVEEDDETYYIKAKDFNKINDDGSTSEKKGYINNDDTSEVTIEFKDNDKEADEGTNLTFEAVADGAAGQDINIKWKIQHGDYTNDDDFNAVKGEVTLKKGDKTVNITIETAQDDNYGRDEEYKVILDSVSDGGIVGDDTEQNCVILNEDDMPKISINDLTTDNDDEGDFIISINTATESKLDVTVTAELIHGDENGDDKTNDDDFSTPSGAGDTKMTITSGDTSVKYHIKTEKASMAGEAEEKYQVDLKEENNATLDDKDGDGTINGANASDERLKKDITILENPLEKLEQIKGVTFNWKDKHRGTREELGVIAQDVEKVYPQVVHMGSDGYRRVSYQFLVAPLIEAVKELKKENEALSKRIKALEDEK